MARILLILCVALLFEAVGVVYLSRGLKQIGEVKEVTVATVVTLIKRGATNPSILLGVFLEAIFFGALLYLLSKRDVSFIWPLTALGFFVTALAAKFINEEEVSGLRWAGISLIVVGAALITWSEKVKEIKREQAAEAASVYPLK
jgi:drug/metabolite transporter (DMT)-like permease